MTLNRFPAPPAVPQFDDYISPPPSPPQSATCNSICPREGYKVVDRTDCRWSRGWTCGVAVTRIRFLFYRAPVVVDLVQLSKPARPNLHGAQVLAALRWENLRWRLRSPTGTTSTTGAGSQSTLGAASYGVGTTGDSSQPHTPAVTTPASSQVRHPPPAAAAAAATASSSTATAITDGCRNRHKTSPFHPLVTHRVTPSTLANTFASTIATKQSSTLAEPDPKAQLVVALQNMATATPTQLFADRYQLIDDRVEGGQAVVCFARDVKGSMLQFAIKCASTSSAHTDMHASSHRILVAPEIIRVAQTFP